MYIYHTNSFTLNGDKKNSECTTFKNTIWVGLTNFTQIGGSTQLSERF